MKDLISHGRYLVATKFLWPLFVRKQILGKDERREGRKPFGPPLKTLRRLRELMGYHYFEGRYAENVKRVAWVTSGAPVEILRAFDFLTIYPENHAALCGARKMIPQLSAHAEERGFSMDLCSYARCDLGCFFSGKTPVGKLPRPSLLLACTNICQTVLFWFRSLSKELNVPLIIIDTPFRYGEGEKHNIAYVKRQLEKLIDICEEVTGEELNREKFERVLELSLDATLLWGEALKSSTNKPAPWNAFDQFIHMAPIVTLRGTYECYSYYMELVDELRDRVYYGIPAIENERFRLLWDNLPVWFNLRGIAEILARRGFNLVISTYTNAWYQSSIYLDVRGDYLESMAKVYTYILLNSDLNFKLQTFENLIREYSCDGVILHADRSCKPYSMGQLDLMNKLVQKGIRSFILDGDHGDQRFYAEEQINNRLNAFLEMFY